MAQTSNPYQSPMQAELPADEPLRAVDFSGRYSLREGLAIARMIESLRKKLYRIAGYGYSLLIVAFIFLFFSGVRGVVVFLGNAEVFFAIGMMLCIAVAVIGIPLEIMKQHKKWKRQFIPQDEQSAGIFQPFSGSVSHAGLAVERAGVKTQRTWSLYTHYQQRQDVILFWLKDQSQADAISRSQFESGEDWLRAVRMAEHHLPKRPGGKISNS